MNSRDIIEQIIAEWMLVGGRLNSNPECLLDCVDYLEHKPWTDGRSTQYIAEHKFRVSEEDAELVHQEYCRRINRPDPRPSYIHRPEHEFLEETPDYEDDELGLFERI